MMFNELFRYELTDGSASDFEDAWAGKKTYCYEYQKEMQTDCFIHVLETARLQLPSSCTVQVHLPSCYHFFYIYEGTIELAEETSLLRGQKSQTLFFQGSGSMTCRTRARSCSFFHASLAGLPLKKYRELLPSVITYTSSALSVSRVKDCIFHLQHCHAAQQTSLTLMQAKWMNDILTELYLAMADDVSSNDNIPAYIQQLKNLLDTAYQQPHSLSELEARFGKSRYRLCREFAQYYDASPIQYLNHRRMEEAKTLLLSTELSVREIGALVGIENTTHFINLFKKETGATPLSFKQKAPAAICELHYPYTPDDRPQ